MGAERTVRTSPARRTLNVGSLERSRPRSFAEWRALRRWGKLPEWEASAPGYLLRLAREEAGLTQGALASLLGVTQQAVAQAERWAANPTVAFVERWAKACGGRMVLRIEAVAS
jgi:DNA-binding XRE family transcriptional regulator